MQHANASAICGPLAKLGRYPGPGVSGANRKLTVAGFTQVSQRENIFLAVEERNHVRYEHIRIDDHPNHFFAEQRPQQLQEA
jgi:hypothetical protein